MDDGDPELADWLAGLYPNPEVRGHMYDVTQNLVAWHGMRGRPEAGRWVEIASALRLSLA